MSEHQADTEPEHDDLRPAPDINPVPVLDFMDAIAGDAGSALDDDDDTSLVTSVILHLMSEHSVINALHLDEEQAHARHRDLHAEATHTHGDSDLRFRPLRILAMLKLISMKHAGLNDLLNDPLTPSP